jgi:hypothetical protein
MWSTERAAFGSVLSLITLAMAAPALARVPIVVATSPAEDTAARLSSQPNLASLPTDDSAFISINREGHEVR